MFLLKKEFSMLSEVFKIKVHVSVYKYVTKMFIYNIMQLIGLSIHLNELLHSMAHYRAFVTLREF